MLSARALTENQSPEKTFMRTIQTLDYSEAKKIIDTIVEKALQMQKAAVIAVADSHGELIAFARMDGAWHLYRPGERWRKAHLCWHGAFFKI